MNKVHVADDCNNDRLECAGGKTLDNSTNKEQMIIVCATTNDCSDDTHHAREEEDGSLSKFTRKSTDEGSSSTNDEKLITTELSDGRDGNTQFDSDDDGSCSKQRTLKISTCR